MTVEIVESISDRLAGNEVHRSFADHEFFKQVHGRALSHEHVGIFLGQWWHPLHYFPTFLARCISALPDIESKSAITRILSQEVGVRSAKAAHEVIYADSMEKAGYDRRTVTGSAPFAETAALLARYEKCSTDRCSALGGIYATEVTDLLMVSAIGEAVKRESGRERNAWVDIHVTQEPDHVDQATNALFSGLTPEEERQVLDSAEEMWRHWTAFFDRLAIETGMIAPSERS
ncbi:iron-containing redox enzyme family protein [Streptomyces sp. NPDC059176]|uniref:iron-containing redox enzyme family protein n=1 Tax=unclassified Streptomyces TaxID=2593676 RepID=UPI0036A265C4